MKTAEEWRTWYALTQGHTVEPATWVADIRGDLEALEDENHFLKLALARNTGSEVDI